MNPLFSLTPTERGPIVNVREQESNIPLTISIETTGLSSLVEIGQQVARGQRIAADNYGTQAALHSSVSGTVLDVKTNFILIKTEGDRIADLLEFSTADSRTMLDNLRNAGINVQHLKQGCTLIINAVPPESGIDGHRFLIEEFNSIMIEGLTYLKDALTPIACTIAIPKGMNWTLAGCTVHEINPVYPEGLNAMVVKAVTGKEMPPEVSVIDAATLYRIGRTIHGKQPVSDIMVKVGATLFQAPVGTQVGLLARLAGFTVSQHDRVILGGPLSGEAVYTLRHGISPSTQAITVLSSGSEPTIKDSPCVGCGECVIKCPARIMPNMISRHSEFGLFENTLAYNIASCFECGLCTYWCPAQRPVLQYIRLAKKELSKQPILEDLRK
ncbi:4Fe-4S dicluster domain-containing protein [Maridesulfovibrio zosterae]|uniref:4Fe-4S dicluster domain-containing protein n=1 Tax=Maridesulfovibrio zosterae TaxID=82171 RepID=UPI000487541B|nr:4Fe-4S dicluster domain-containing protein [Maridesulfovibrio zosterae]